MRRVVLDQLGEPRHVLKVTEVEPPSPGPGEVLVRLTARSINPADLLLVRGHYGAKPNLPLVPGNEGTGVIEALGSGVTGPSPGTRVICYGRLGTWQEQITYPASDLILVPEGMGDEEAAQAITNPLSAWLMILQRLGLRTGDWLLQTAAGSALGNAAIQIANLHGIHTINVVRDRAAVEPLNAIGADAVIVSPDEDIIEQTRAATSGRGATGAIDAVGGQTASAALKSVTDGGTLLTYGLLSGTPGSFDNGEIIFRRLTVSGFWLRHWFVSTSPNERNQVIKPLFKRIATREIELFVAGRFDLADIKQAVFHAEQKKKGKILLVG